jgi:micrococcal nuclease
LSPDRPSVPHRPRRRLAALPLLALLFLPAALAGEPVRLVEIYDADTVRIARPDGTQSTVRLIGVDAPEVQGKYRDAELGGQAASAFARTLLGVDRVELEADATGDDVDRYGRLLRYLRLPDGRDAGAEIIAAGFARAYRRFTYTRKDSYVALETGAREAGRGLWGRMGIGEGMTP